MFTVKCNTRQLNWYIIFSWSFLLFKDHYQQCDHMMILYVSILKCSKPTIRTGCNLVLASGMMHKRPQVNGTFINLMIDTVYQSNTAWVIYYCHEKQSFEHKQSVVITDENILILQLYRLFKNTIPTECTACNVYFYWDVFLHLVNL